MAKYKIILIIFILTIIGGYLRFYKLSENPISLNVDEVSIGYNAYSILKTGRDEYGQFMPLIFKSLGDYKPPLYIYLTSIAINIFGLNEFSVRFFSAFLGTLSVPLFFIFFRLLTKNTKVSLIGSAFLTISPWHIYFSRLASESLVATFLLVLGIIFFIKIMNGRFLWGIGAALFLAMSMYTYHSEKIFVPLIVLALLIINKQSIVENKKNRQNIVVFIVCLVLFLIPFIISTIFGTGATRAQMTIITNDINFTRLVVTDTVIYPANSAVKFLDNIASPSILLIFYWMRKYLNYLHPSFLFLDGLGMTETGTYNLGIMYFFEIPLIVFGLISLIKDKIIHKKIIISWLLLGIIPASLTLNEQHPIRTLLIIPMTLLISAYGVVTLFSFIHTRYHLHKKLAIYVFISLVITWNLIHAFLLFSVHFPNQKGEGLMEGTKQSVLAALSLQDKYTEIVYDPVRGVEGPYLVNAPHAYILFYSHYDPAKYLSEPKIEGKNLFSFGKFTIRNINWREDRIKYNTLFIGSPWSLPEKDLKEANILQRIYLSNGKLALLVVSPK